MSPPGDQLTKMLILLPLESSGMESETIWVQPLGDRVYKICNIPFYAYNLSVDDIVYAEQEGENIFPTLRTVVKKSGNRTIRMIFEADLQDSSAQKEILETLVKLGCGCERLDERYVAINVPETTNSEGVAKYLQTKNVNWEVADPQLDP